METNAVQRLSILINRGQTPADKEKIKKLADIFANRDGHPELSEIEVKIIENALNLADNKDNIYTSNEIDLAQKYVEIFHFSNFYGELSDTEDEEKNIRDTALKNLENNDSRYTRFQAVIALGQSALANKKLRPEITALLKTKQDKDPEIMVEAQILRTLVNLGEKQFQSLADQRERIARLSEYQYEGQDQGLSFNCDRINRTLGSIKDKYAVSVLIGNMRDEYWQAPGAAARALANHPEDPRVIPALVNGYNLPSRDYVWCESLHSGIDGALKKLGFSSKESTIPALIKSLETSDNNILVLTLRAFETLGPAAKSALPDLYKLKEKCSQKGDTIMESKIKEAIRNIEQKK